MIVTEPVFSIETMRVVKVVVVIEPGTSIEPVFFIDLMIVTEPVFSIEPMHVVKVVVVIEPESSIELVCFKLI